MNKLAEVPIYSVRKAVPFEGMWEVVDFQDTIVCTTNKESNAKLIKWLLENFT